MEKYRKIKMIGKGAFGLVVTNNQFLLFSFFLRLLFLSLAKNKLVLSFCLKRI